MKITLDEKDYTCEECGNEMFIDYAVYGDSYDEEMCLVCESCDSTVRVKDIGM